MAKKDNTSIILEEACRKHGTTLSKIQETYKRLNRQANLNQAIYKMAVDDQKRKITLEGAKEMVETWSNLIGIHQAEEILFETEEYIREIIENQWGKDAHVFFSRETATIVAHDKLFGKLEIKAPRAEDSPCP